MLDESEVFTDTQAGTSAAELQSSSVEKHDSFPDSPEEHLKKKKTTLDFAREGRKRNEESKEGEHSYW